jgi:predicted GNAT superfamily acetyltransferase
MVDVVIRDARGEELVEGLELLRASLGFKPADAIPAWLALTTTEAGGLALGAFARRSLVGFSYALPALRPGGPHLFSCGLAVTPARRGQGVGRRLKLAQRDRARSLGIDRIRWTADPLAAPALTLYLSGLGARLVGYRAGMYDAVRATSNDDVEIDWHVGDPPAARPLEARVEIPFDPSCRSPVWRRTVRRQMSSMLAEGLVGIGVEAHGHRRFVRFGEPVA